MNEQEQAPEAALRCVVSGILPEHRHLVLLAAQALAQLYPVTEGRNAGQKLRLVRLDA